ncbi:Crp/Fnr family transcriptional regulator [Mucilaginibacter psychrotolerans]|uniref:Crp/Fnr family transcriptional regulator n=1 Tax=Mucilaginibacter psychrotolerans TaxID=1524096 RepID=A0A4Y8SBQ6_9SPHI|nr:Crp/Fnr family transcriptional regulator [Mucilaginibacter psychrotolerans]TFF35776.1 Crp/Fnr family transcriptional regulator [Mucilaginibacter psychrotolerans]
MEKLLSHFLGKGIPEAEAAQIVAAFKVKKFAKGEHFIEEGRTSKHLAFINEGIFQYYHLRDGKEVTTYVTGEKTFLASIASFFSQKPSKEYVRALADSEVLQVSYTELAKLKTENQAFRSFYISALENLAIGIDESKTNLIMLTADERYAELLKNEPKLLQQIPLQYLASILGITPRHLSRIRNNIS